MRRFVPITLRVNLIIVASLVLGIGAMVSWLAITQYTRAIDDTDRTLDDQSQLFYYAIKNLMLPGEAPIAVSFIADLRNTGLEQELMLWRSDGTEAFVDNATLARVNRSLAARGSPKRFELRPEPTGAPASKGDADGSFARTVSTGESALLQESGGGRVVRTIYAPLSNGPLCAGCHGSDHCVRGVIDITTDLTDELGEPRRALFLAGGSFLALVTVLAFLLSGFMHRAVILPVKRIGEVCSGVAEGRFDERVAFTRSDEIGDLGRTVNAMVDGLFERFHLAKYVSASTVESIHGGESSRRVTMTILFSDVRGFTAFTEAHRPEEVVTLLNRIHTVQEEIIHRYSGDVDKFVGDEVMGLFKGEDAELCACAAGVAIQRELLSRRADLYGGLGVGVGINRGEVIEGKIGSERRADHTVIGDHVNFAARLCDLAKPGMVVVSEVVHDLVRGKVDSRGPVIVKVKGKREQQRIYTVQSLQEEPECARV
jgi:adenylate cyclase